MNTIGLVMSIALTTSVQAPAPAAPTVTGTSLLCGPVAGLTSRDRDNALRFCSDEITRGVITELIVAEAIVRIRVTGGFATAMRNDRISGDELVRKWLRWWRAVTDEPTATLVVESDHIEVVRGSPVPDGDDQVTWPKD
jgi:hypothetical protein